MDLLQEAVTVVEDVEPIVMEIDAQTADKSLQQLNPKSHSCRKRFMVIDGSAAALWRFRSPLLQALRNRGHLVTVCAPKDPTLSQIIPEDPVVNFRRIGVEFREIRMERQGMNPYRELRALAELWMHMRATRPDIVLTYSIKSSLYGSLAARLAQVENCYSSITGLGYLFIGKSEKVSLLKRLLQRILGAALAGDKRVFFQNPDDRDLFLQLGLVRNQDHTALINGSGVDLSHFRREPIPVGPCTFLMIARIQKHKGVIEYVEAARLLKREFKDARFQLLGPFDDHPSAISKAQLEQMLRDKCVEYLGACSDVRKHLKGCHVFVLPSYREGTPLSTLEALAVGRPVVTTDVPGCRETVKHGENGYLVAPQNVTSLSDAMKRFLENPILSETMGARSRAIAEQKYDVREVVATMLGVMNLSQL
jgi:glycosyltransferase involved in cell wall biosynthesis